MIYNQQMHLLSMCVLMALDKRVNSVTSNRAPYKHPAEHPLDGPLMPSLNDTDFLTPKI